MGVCIANVCVKGIPSSGFPLLLKSNYSKTDFLGLFSQVRNNKLMHLKPDFPDFGGKGTQNNCIDKYMNRKI